NFAPRPGAIPGTITASATSFTTFNFWNFNAGATQLIYDFGQTDGRYRAASANQESFKASERTSLNLALLGVRTAYFQARAQKALVMVAADTLTNQREHLAQVDAQFKVGQRAQIDVVQARTNVANARVTLTNAKNAYEIAKSQLNQAMGVEGDTDFEVAEDELGSVEGEDQPARYLVAKAVMTRPELAAYAWQYEAQLRTIRSLEGGYGPSIAATTSATEIGVELGSLVPNWSGGATVTWPIFQGGLTRGQVHEAEANLDGIVAQSAAERLQIGVDVNQGRSAVRAAKENIGATEEALTSAREQLLLAERRYATGLGNIIELSDAQVAVTSAAAQAVQAHFNLSTGRAQLLNALGGR
ncbi:MAG: TolC family protein, partial [Polyangiaceae bacterium]